MSLTPKEHDELERLRDKQSPGALIAIVKLTLPVFALVSSLLCIVAFPALAFIFGTPTRDAVQLYDSRWLFLLLPLAVFVDCAIVATWVYLIEHEKIVNEHWKKFWRSV